MQVILANVGSLGDIHPYLAIGAALRQRGHAVTIVTNQNWEELVRRQGLDHVSVGHTSDYAAAAANPNLWHPIKGFGVLWRHLLAPAIVPTFRAIEDLRRRGPTAVVAAPFMFGARLAQQKFGVPMLSAYTVPSLLRTRMAPLTIADHQLPRWTPRSLVGLTWSLLDRYKLQPLLLPTVHRLSKEMSLPEPTVSIVGEWMHSPSAGITLFPEWFAPCQPDWPAQVALGGFPMLDDSQADRRDDLLDDFLDGGPAPLVFMPGSAMQHAQHFFQVALQACGQLNVRGVFLTPHREQVPGSLPPTVLCRPYAPFASLLSRAAGLVHHGGIGSCAQAMRAGVPQLVVPNAHDQFDNGVCIERLGLGQWIRPARLSGDSLARRWSRLTHDPASRRAREAVRQRMADDAALERICAAVESLA